MSDIIKTLKWYDGMPGHLFPLRKFALNDPASKAPLHGCRWREERWSTEQLEAYRSDGHAIAYALGQTDLVIDVEAATPGGHKQDGRQAFYRLWGTDDLTGYPVVYGPRGGFHVYCDISEYVDTHTVPAKHPDAPGIDFLTYGRYVVAAGSPHWQGGNYYTNPDEWGFLQ